MANKETPSNLTLLKNLTNQLIIRDTAIFESEKKFRGFFENASAGMCIANINTGMFVEVNQALCDWLGYTDEELLSKPMTSFIKKSTVEKTDSVIEKMAKGEIKEKIADFINEYRHRDGSSVWLNWNASVPNEEGINYSVCSNITKELEQARKIEEQQKLINLSVEMGEDVACLHKPTGEWIWVSPSVKKVLGYKPEDVLGKSPYEFVDPTQIANIKNTSHRKILDGKGAQYTVSRFKKADGEWIWMETLYKSLRNEKGEVTELWSSSRDITEQYELQEKLIKSEARYKLIAEGSGELIALHETSGKISWVSPSAPAVCGWLPAELVGKAFNKFIHPEDVSRNMNMIEEALSMGVNIKAESRFKIKGDGYQWFETSFTPVVSDKGEIESFISTSSNINKRKIRERKLIKEIEAFRDLSKLETIGTYELKLDGSQEYAYVSPSFIEMFGLNLNIDLSKLGSAISGLFEKKVFDVVNEDWLNTIEGKQKEFNSSYWLTTADGRRRLFRGKGRVKRDLDGTPLTMIGTVQDITNAQAAFENAINEKN